MLAKFWEQHRRNWGYAKDQGKKLLLADADSGWTDFRCAGKITSVKFKTCLSQIIAGFGIPKNLEPDKFCEWFWKKQFRQ